MKLDDVLDNDKTETWEKVLSNGDFTRAKNIAAALKIDPNAVRCRLRMTRLSPKIIHRILSGDIPAKLTDAALHNPIPKLWREQEESFLKKHHKRQLTLQQL